MLRQRRLQNSFLNILHSKEVEEEAELWDEMANHACSDYNWPKRDFVRQPEEPFDLSNYNIPDDWLV